MNETLLERLISYFNFAFGGMAIAGFVFWMFAFLRTSAGPNTSAVLIMVLILVDGAAIWFLLSIRLRKTGKAVQSFRFSHYEFSSRLESSESIHLLLKRLSGLSIESRAKVAKQFLEQLDLILSQEQHSSKPSSDQ